jgi:chromate reductase, NAD(P)H dehydrogenase (quinone)
MVTTINFHGGDEMNDVANNLVAISGSLRDKSSNSALLRAIAAMVPSHIPVTFYNDMGQLPHFNPDVDTDDPPMQVIRWRNCLAEASGVLICTPEYAKGVPGSLKNALDWIVSSGELVNKPVAVVSASPHPSGGETALNSLLGTLEMMNAAVVKGGALKVPFISLKLGSDGEIVDEETKNQSKDLVDALVQAMPTAKLPESKS